MFSGTTLINVLIREIIVRNYTSKCNFFIQKKLKKTIILICFKILNYFSDNFQLILISNTNIFNFLIDKIHISDGKN
jgi:hypothetical protein